MASTKQALQMLRTYPRIALNNIKQRYKRPTKVQKPFRHSGQRKHATLPPLGFAGGQIPFYTSIPKEPYYRDISQRKEYVPLSLLRLQRMIELGRVDTSKPIDLTALCNTKLVDVKCEDGQYGIHLTDEGADVFDAEVCLEVQWVDELAVAAIERAGSVVTTRYYDPLSLPAVTNPKRFFAQGRPLPACKTPTSDVLEYYSSARGRGYLADTSNIEQDRKELAQKYGYELPELSHEVQQASLRKKTNLQIFYGLQPGWIINLPDQEIVKPTDPELQQFYNTDRML